MAESVPTLGGVHGQHDPDELFFVINGSIRAWVEGEPLDVPADSLIFLPAGRPDTLVRLDVSGDAHVVVHGHREQRIPEH